MKRKFSLELIEMFNYYCDIKKDEKVCKIIIKLFDYIYFDDYDSFEYYMLKVKNQEKLTNLMIDNVIESLGGY